MPTQSCHGRFRKENTNNKLSGDNGEHGILHLHCATKNTGGTRTGRDNLISLYLLLWVLSTSTANVIRWSTDTLIADSNLNLNVQNKILKYWEQLSDLIVTSRYFPRGPHHMYVAGPAHGVQQVCLCTVWYCTVLLYCLYTAATASTACLDGHVTWHQPTRRVCRANNEKMEHFSLFHNLLKKKWDWVNFSLGQRFRGS